MNEPKGLFKHKFILILTIFSFVAASAEGIVFYPDDDAFFKFLMVLQNSISAFAFRPSIGLRDAMQKMVEDPNTVRMVICYAYGLAVFTAPYCTVAAVYRLLENMLRFAFRIRKSKGGKMTTLFGYNEEVKTLINDFIKTADKDSFLYVVTDKEISSDERFELSKHNCFVSTLDMTVLTPEQAEREFKKLHIDRAETLILFDESSLKNFSVLRMFRMGNEETGVALMSGAKVICRCEDEGMSKLVEDYYDSRRGGRFAFDLETVSLPELQVYKLYNDVPLHTFYLNSDKNLSEWNIRMLVVGFGETGRQAVLKAMNLGVDCTRRYTDNNITLLIISLYRRSRRVIWHSSTSGHCRNSRLCHSLHILQISGIVRMDMQIVDIGIIGYILNISSYYTYDQII